jgi:hypothetical protein
LWRFVEPNAKAVISINWQRVRESPAVAMLRDQWLNAGVVRTFPAVELLDDIDRVVISSSAAAGESGEAPLLIAAQGRFDVAQVRQLFTRMGAKKQAYSSFEVFRPQGTDAKNLAYVLFDAGTILFGDPPSVFAALDRTRFPEAAAEAGSIVTRATAMDSAYDFWIIMSAPEAMESDRLAGLLRGGDWMPAAQGFEAGVTLRTGLTADVTVRLASEGAAKHAIVQMTQLIALESKDKTAEPQTREILKKLKFTSDGAAAKISLRLNPQELEASARAFAAAHPPSPVRAVTAAAIASPALAPEPGKKPSVIRIEGLDDGPIEIPYHDH